MVFVLRVFLSLTLSLCLKMGQSQPILFIFVFFTLYNSINWLMLRWCAWDSNPGWRMEGAGESTELWRHPTSFINSVSLSLFFFLHLIFSLSLLFALQVFHSLSFSFFPFSVLSFYLSLFLFCSLACLKWYSDVKIETLARLTRNLPIPIQIFWLTKNSQSLN